MISWGQYPSRDNSTLWPVEVHLYISSGTGDVTTISTFNGLIKELEELEDLFFPRVADFPIDHAAPPSVPYLAPRTLREHRASHVSHRGSTRPRS